MSERVPDKHSLSLRLLYPLIWLVVRALLLVLGPLRVRGRERVPRRGGLLILSNHRADIDPVVLQIASPRLVHFMAKHELFTIPVLGSLISWFRAFPVRRGAPDRAAIRHAIALIEAGEAVLVFPEGALTETGKLQPILPGAALIVRSARCPVVCVGLRRTERMMPYGAVVPRPAFRRVEVHWGQPRTFDPHASHEDILEWVRNELLRASGEA